MAQEFHGINIDTALTFLEEVPPQMITDLRNQIKRVYLNTNNLHSWLKDEDLGIKLEPFKVGVVEMKSGGIISFFPKQVGRIVDIHLNSDDHLFALSRLSVNNLSFEHIRPGSMHDGGPETQLSFIFWASIINTLAKTQITPLNV